MNSEGHEAGTRESSPDGGWGSGSSDTPSEYAIHYSPAPLVRPGLRARVADRERRTHVGPIDHRGTALRAIAARMRQVSHRNVAGTTLHRHASASYMIPSLHNEPAQSPPYSPGYSPPLSPTYSPQSPTYSPVSPTMSYSGDSYEVDSADMEEDGDEEGDEEYDDDEGLYEGEYAEDDDDDDDGDYEEEDAVDDDDDDGDEDYLDLDDDEDDDEDGDEDEDEDEDYEEGDERGRIFEFGTAHDYAQSWALKYAKVDEVAEPVSLLVRYLCPMESGEMGVKGNGGIICTGHASVGGVVVHVPGIEDVLEVESSEDFKCPICLDIFKEPVTAVPCGHTFCKACLARSLIAKRPCHCPTCRGALLVNQPTPARTVQNLINNTKVRCINSMAFNMATQKYESIKGPVVVDGYRFTRCKEVLRLEDRDAHQKECAHTPVYCSFNADGCSKILMRKDLGAHEEACSFHAHWCECGMRVRTGKVETHDLVCTAKPVPCIHARWGCAGAPRRGDMAAHLKECHYEALKDVLAKEEARTAKLENKVRRLVEDKKKQKVRTAKLKSLLEKQKKEKASFASPDEGPVEAKKVKKQVKKKDVQAEEVEKEVQKTEVKQIQAECSNEIAKKRKRGTIVPRRFRAAASVAAAAKKNKMVGQNGVSCGGGKKTKKQRAHVAEEEKGTGLVSSADVSK